MKSIFPFLALLGFAGTSLALAPGERSISNIPGATESLLRIVSPKFYQTLLLSPVEGWIVARGWLSGNRLAGSRIIHSELNGRSDALALELADNLNVLGLAPEQSSRPAVGPRSRSNLSDRQWDNGAFLRPFRRGGWKPDPILRRGLDGRAKA